MLGEFVGLAGVLGMPLVDGFQGEAGDLGQAEACRREEQDIVGVNIVRVVLEHLLDLVHGGLRVRLQLVFHLHRPDARAAELEHFLLFRLLFLDGRAPQGFAGIKEAGNLLDRGEQEAHGIVDIPQLQRAERLEPEVAGAPMSSFSVRMAMAVEERLSLGETGRTTNGRTGMKCNNTPLRLASSTNHRRKRVASPRRTMLIPPMRLFFSVLMASALAAMPAAAGDGKQKHSFAFHAEGDRKDGAERTFMHEIAGREVYFRMVPEITHMDFDGFVPFRADDGTSYGAAFVLNRHGSLKLNQLSTARQGTYVAASVDMQLADYMVIDKPIKDGVIILWRGLTAEHVQYLEKELKLKVIKGPGQTPSKP